MILWCLEAGLVHQWKVRTWARMKDEQGGIMLKDEEALKRGEKITWQFPLLDVKRN